MCHLQTCQDTPHLKTLFTKINPLYKVCFESFSLYDNFIVESCRHVVLFSPLENGIQVDTISPAHNDDDIVELCWQKFLSL